MTQIPVGLQLYTVRDDADKDLIGTLKALSGMGYVNVELAGLYGKTAAEAHTLFADAGLKPVSAHVGLNLLQGENVAKTIEDYLTLGVYTVVVPFIGDDVRQGGAGYPALAKTLNETAETLGRFGVKLGYHNHDFEFNEQSNGKPGIEVLIEETDSQLVSFELDTYWALKAGFDPVAFLNKYPSRFSLLHIKDMDPADKFFAEVETGLLPLDGIIEAAPAAGAQYLFVEQDVTRRPALESVKISLDNLKAKGYA